MEGGNALRRLGKAPKTSVVADLTSPATPSEQKQAPSPSVPTPEPDPRPAPVQEPVAQPKPQPAPPTPKSQEAETKPVKATFYQDREARDRARAAFVSTQAQTGYRTLSEFINAAIDRECHRLEAAYNDGEPFVTGANLVKRGRPFGS